MIVLSRFLRNGCAALSLALLLTTTVFAQEGDAFAQGNQEFAAGNFREAIDQYTKLVSGGETSAAVFYNLGNAWFRTGDFGQAILNYERALTLEPQHPEATANLQLARDKARALELRKNWLERTTAHVTAAQYSVVGAASFWIALFALAGLFLHRRRSGMFAGVLVLACLTLAIAGYGFYAHETGANGQALAIVTAKTTEARLATADNAGTILTLPPGSEIKILSTRGDWVYAALPNDLRGWIPTKNAELVRL